MVVSLAYQAAELAARALPRRAADALAVGIAEAAFAARVPARIAAETNLARLLPAAPPAQHRRLARASFAHFALAFTDFLRLRSLRAEDLARAIAVEGGEHLAAARASGRGVILLSAHLGNWEWGAAYLGAYGIPVHLAARTHADPRIERMFAARREAFGVRALPARARFAHAAAVLRSGEWLALMGDRPAVAGAPRAGSICAWAGALAQRTGALVLPVALVRESAERHALLVEPPLAPRECREGGYRETVARWLQRYPGQWAAFEPLPEGLA